MNFFLSVVSLFFKFCTTRMSAVKSPTGSVPRSLVSVEARTHIC